MTRTSKIPRYDEFNKAPNAYGLRAQEPKSWITKLDPEIPLNLELGCGKAEVSLAMANKYPEENWIGVDLKADRLWRASKTALEDKLDNVAFIQSDILRLEDFIKPDTVKMIWLTHPDPFPKDRQAKHRMLNRNFLDIYKKVLQRDGVIRLKTDNRALFEWAIELLSEQPDVETLRSYDNLHEESEDEDLLVMTTYSDKFIKQGTPINFCEFRFK